MPVRAYSPPAATTEMPYVIARPSWFAVSTWSGRCSRFGAAASLAGIHSIATLLVRKLPANGHHGRSTTMTESSRRQRSTSPTAITTRRSNRSARRPPSGAKNKPGSRLLKTTPENAKFFTA